MEGIVELIERDYRRNGMDARINRRRDRMGGGIEWTEAWG